MFFVFGRWQGLKETTKFQKHVLIECVLCIQCHVFGMKVAARWDLVPGSLENISRIYKWWHTCNACSTPCCPFALVRRPEVTVVEGAEIAV